MVGRRRAERSAAASLVKDCEAFLSGRLAERLLRTGGFVPNWVWMNLLAHGTQSELVRIRDGRPLTRWPWISHLERWHAARSFLAAEVLAIALLHGPLDTVQRQVLWPLEERLADSRSDVFGPTDWVTAVLAGLEEYRQAARRSSSWPEQLPGSSG
jgi:hypothetical protein